MTLAFHSLVAGLALLCAFGTGAALEEVVETWPDGSVRVRYEVDAAGRKHGALAEFLQDGTLVRRAQYRAGTLHGREFRNYDDGRRRSVTTFANGVLHGRFESFHANGERELVANYSDGLFDGKYVESSADGKRVLSARYERGLLDGGLSIKDDGETITRQEWKAGALVELDGMQPFPRARADVLAAVEEIERAPADAPDDPMAAERAAALRHLQAYRYLCGVPHEGMELVDEWNELCTAAAEVCRALGRLSHTPERPPGMDEELYKKGALGAGRSNLSMGRSDIASSVDAYMDDSDPSNIDRLGHRRWCLNPHMEKTGFGRVDEFSAMWSTDGSGPGASGLAHVLYPPAGFVPVEYFGARHAWSVSLLNGRVPNGDELAVEIVALDDHYAPFGEPLELDYRAVAGGGFGGSACVVFRPVGLVVEPGQRYRCKLSFDGGKTNDLDYVVEFVGGSAGGE